MDWFEWMADQHTRAMVFAVAVSVLLPYALVAAQRPGRGIKPWWTTTRFLAWAGLGGAIIALVTGQFLAKNLGLLPEGVWIIRDEWTDLRIHQYLAGASVFLGYFCIRAAHASRKEHQGLGAYALIVGLLWAVVAWGAGHYGAKLAKTRKHEILLTIQTQAQKQAELMSELHPVQSGSNRMLKILDYASLVPMHSEPVRSPAHGNRWIRVWTTPNAVEAYRRGDTLPENTLVVMSSVEDRWGRPTYDAGPLYWREVLPGNKSQIGMYWSNVPESKRNEVGGSNSVNWAEPDAGLAGCTECHATGMAPHGNRSRIRPVPVAPRRPAAETQ